MKPKALVLRAAGSNCDVETAYAFELAGASAHLLHINQLLRTPSLLDDYQILSIPGGFTYGDDIAAGRILANQLSQHLSDALAGFVESGRPIIGICNGFQALVKTHLLPGGIDDAASQTCTLTNNACGRFVDRWIHLTPQKSRCIWTAGMDESLFLPIAHGEGRFVPGSESVRRELREGGQVVLTYANPDGSPAQGAFPANPNGSVDDIAGICDATGLIFGLMPHPERYVDVLQHPAWTSTPQLSAEGQGLRIFRNAVNHVACALTAGV